MIHVADRLCGLPPKERDKLPEPKYDSRRLTPPHGYLYSPSGMTHPVWWCRSSVRTLCALASAPSQHQGPFLGNGPAKHKEVHFKMHMRGQVARESGGSPRRIGTETEANTDLSYLWEYVSILKENRRLQC